MTTPDPTADLEGLARGLRLVADAHRKQGETKFTVRAIDQMADTVEGAEATISRLEQLLHMTEELATAAYRDAEHAEERLAAIDALLKEWHRGLVGAAYVLEMAGRILHPPVSAPETLPITHDEGTPDGPR